MKNFLVIVLFLLFGLDGFAQQPDARIIIKGVNEKFAKVKDYQANARIDTRISFLKILPQKAIVYFKQPDKFRIKSTGIAILPKQQFDNLFSLLRKEDAYEAFVSGAEVIQGRSTVLLNIIPRSDTSDLVLAKTWVDTKENLIIRSQLTTKSNGTVLIDYQYGKYSDYALPDQIKFTVEVKKFKIPKAVSADINSTPSKVPPGKEPKTGNIIIDLKEYKINLGVADSYFK
jgi:outer membrane lipoprotein-sorting protein